MEPIPNQSESLATQPLRHRLSRLLDALETGLVERGRAVRLALLAALAGEHTLLVGPPGTAKSALARRLHRAFRDARYFERLLTRFTVPEELFGPLSISALEQDRYERQTAGFLPQAEIAFIDEVFKANSAILNALLTLLNEREFDNGAERVPCPLISVIGATNAVPEDEVGDAFFDRFLVRLPVGPVTETGFTTLLALAPEDAMPTVDTLGESDRQALAHAARGVGVPAEVADLLAELRRRLAVEDVYVSDRRWVKIVWLLRVAAACEGRDTVSVWDLWLLPWCAAPDAARQEDIESWLAGRLGVRETLSPPRLTRVVEAFEAQLDVERNANDLDYDESGRLRFNAAVDDAVSDAKGAAQATRMSATRIRRYGARHIEARLGQIDELCERIAGYIREVEAQWSDLTAYAAQSLWLDPDFAHRAEANLAATAETIAILLARARDARAGFEALPRMPGESGDASGEMPEPVFHESLVP
jgi:MoxR-like ATPase